MQNLRKAQSKKEKAKEITISDSFFKNYSFCDKVLKEDFFIPKTERRQNLILANHVPLALVIWKITSVLLSGLPQNAILLISIVGSFFSHFLADRFPHADWSFAEGKLNKKKIFLLASIDVGLAIVVWFVVSIAFFHKTSLTGFLCAAFACAPDLNKFVKFPKPINKLHEASHTLWRKNGNNNNLPLYQLMAVIVVIMVSLVYYTLGF